MGIAGWTVLVLEIEAQGRCAGVGGDVDQLRPEKWEELCESRGAFQVRLDWGGGDDEEGNGSEEDR